MRGGALGVPGARWWATLAGPLPWAAAPGPLSRLPAGPWSRQARVLPLQGQVLSNTSGGTSRSFRMWL